MEQQFEFIFSAKSIEKLSLNLNHESTRNKEKEQHLCKKKVKIFRFVNELKSNGIEPNSG